MAVALEEYSFNFTSCERLKYCSSLFVIHCHSSASYILFFISWYRKGNFVIVTTMISTGISIIAKGNLTKYKVAVNDGFGRN